MDGLDGPPDAVDLEGRRQGPQYAGSQDFGRDNFGALHTSIQEVFDDLNFRSFRHAASEGYMQFDYLRSLFVSWCA